MPAAETPNPPSRASAAPPGTPLPAGLPPAPGKSTGRRCENCGAPLYGEHCYACGQPTKGLIRQFSSILGDFFDTVFDIDSRVLRTIGPLMLRPGYLSLEYFAGRRVRYVTPMRLFLFLSLVAFFTIHGNMEINQEDSSPVSIHTGDGGIANAATPEAAQKMADEAIAQLQLARKQAPNVPGLAKGMDKAQDKIRAQAADRIAYLGRVAAAKSAGTASPSPAKPEDKGINFNTNGKPWDPVSNPLTFGWLPDIANRGLNHRLAHSREVLDSGQGVRALIDALFNVLPQTLIVLMPLFALMLKAAYLFKRRLYMEHLIVALHSHAFISLAITLLVGIDWIQTTFAAAGGALATLLGWCVGLLIAWIPLYLLLMQKRIYGQGWIMTLLKFFVLGICYSVLLGLGLAGATVIGLLTL